MKKQLIQWNNFWYTSATEKWGFRILKSLEDGIYSKVDRGHEGQGGAK